MSTRRGVLSAVPSLPPIAPIGTDGHPAQPIQFPTHDPAPSGGGIRRSLFMPSTAFDALDDFAHQIAIQVPRTVSKSQILAAIMDEMDDDLAARAVRRIQAAYRRSA